MVKFIEGEEENGDGNGEGRWKRIMQSTKRTFREIWGDSEELPERDE